MKTFYGIVSGGALIAAFGINAISAQAQDFTSPYFNIAIARATPAGARRTTAGNRNQQRLVQAQVTRGREVIRNGNATTTFHPTGDLVIDRAFTHNVKLYEQEARKQNLATNDLAATVSAVIDVGLQLYKGIPELTPPQFESVVSRVRSDLLKDPKVQGMDDRTKQALHESWANTLVEMAAGMHQARRANDEAALARERARVGKILHGLLGASPDAVKVSKTSVALPD